MPPWHLGGHRVLGGMDSLGTISGHGFGNWGWFSRSNSLQIQSLKAWPRERNRMCLRVLEVVEEVVQEP